MHGTAFVMGPKTGYGGEHDTGKGGSQSQVHDNGIWIPCRTKQNTSMGTITNPPPIPNNPASTPATAPTRIYINKIVVIKTPARPLNNLLNNLFSMQKTRLSSL
jgi:hypothetical protein